MSPPQRTCGFTDYSEESLVNDQLAVAREMIRLFVEVFPERNCEPWVRIPSWRAADHPRSHTAEEAAAYQGSLDEIEKEISAFCAGDASWTDLDRQKALFLARLMRQIDECINYTNKRLRAIQVCARVGDLILQGNRQSEVEEALVAAGPLLAAELMIAFGGLGGMTGVGTLGYCAIKGARRPPNLFAARLLKQMRQLLHPEALRRGYTDLAKG